MKDDNDDDEAMPPPAGQDEMPQGTKVRRSARKLRPNAKFAAEEFELTEVLGKPTAAATALSIAAVTDPGLLIIDDPGAEDLVAEQSRAEKRRQARCKGLLSRLRPTDAAAASQQAATLGELGKKRRKKAPSVEAKAATLTRRLHDVPRNADGTPRMPITLFKGLTVDSLGTVVTDKPKFHAKSIEAKAMYVNEIIDGGDEPLFRITCFEGDKEPIVIEAATSSGAWAEVGKRVNDCKESVVGKRMFTQLSGPEMFGFSHPTIVRLLQELPGAERLSKYEMQKFEIIGSTVAKKSKDETVAPVIAMATAAPIELEEEEEGEGEEEDETKDA